MSDSGDNLKYKWTPDSTTLLVSVWTDKQVQKQLEYTAKPQLIWESVARYMKKKGYNVTAKQCRSRMKQVLVCYREAKRAGTRAGVEQYYDCIDKVLKNRRSDPINLNGIDTVDSTNNVKSPPKDVKTNKNLQMRYKYHTPIESIYRSEALSPTWTAGRDEDYPDSPESNETVLAQPFRVLSPVRDAATNTRHQLDHLSRKTLHSNTVATNTIEPAVKDSFHPNSLANNRFSEIPFQNTVQNVQNQIIQENMQQNQAYLQQNLLQNQLSGNNLLQMNPTYRQNLLNTNENLYAGQGVQWRTGNDQLPILLNQIQSENIYYPQNQLQNNPINNQLIPQEPRKLAFRQNLESYRQYQNSRGQQNHIPNGLLSPRYSPEYLANLEEKTHNLNETYDQMSGNGMNLPNIDTTTLTTNATFNDDTLSIEFLQDSPSPSDDGTTKVKDLGVNTDIVPNAPFRKKKAQKLEQLMLSAINSQNDVVNKILTAQNDMVTKFLDLDRDRQNRLENRLDHLMDVVHATVLNKSSDRESDQQEPIITNLLPPPKLGVVPPKLDLVPPKPCRFPSTLTGNNTNQNTEMTRPGVISPPARRIGSIWTKLGPVSQSPFVKAQQQLGFQTIPNLESRTQSSAERRILQDIRMNMDPRTVIEETLTFLENERHVQEKIENAKIQSNMNQTLTAKKRLFTNREPTAAMILSAAFLENESQYIELVENARINCGNNDITRMCLRYLHQQAAKESDKLVSGQGDSYERLRRLNLDEKFIDEPSDSSTPAKPSAPQLEARPTIQQLAQLVMQSSRWRDVAQNKLKPLDAPRKDVNLRRREFDEQRLNILKREEQLEEERKKMQFLEDEERRKREMLFQEERRTDFLKDNNGIAILRDNNEIAGELGRNKKYRNYKETDGKAKAINWLQDRYSYGDQILKLNQGAPRPIGFSVDDLNAIDARPNFERRDYLKKRANFDERLKNNRQTVHFSDDMGPFGQLKQNYPQRYYTLQNPKYIEFDGPPNPQNRDMIDRYMREIELRRVKDDSDDEEFLDTTTTMSPFTPTEGALKAGKGTCVIS